MCRARHTTRRWRWTGQSRAAFEKQYLTGSFYLYHIFSVIIAQPLSFGREERKMRKVIIGLVSITIILFFLPGIVLAGSLDKAGTQWVPYIEWSLTNSSYGGNPYDLVATVTFTHAESGERITTEMFYAGGSTWKFRFAGTQAGTWTLTTSSSDSELSGKTGTVTITPNPAVHGFVKKFNQKWGWQGSDTAFVPQLVMYWAPTTYYNQPSLIDNDIDTFMNEHGFNGFHTNVRCRWFDINEDTYDNISTPNPDIRTFEALELLITKVHAEGGLVHIWAWGDQQRHQTPVKWGINGAEDKRLQRYIAARLGPLPGWSMGYGFDLDEWVTASQLEAWRDNMHSKFGWPHFLGGRPSGPNRGTDHAAYVSWNEPLDYSSYEHHQPDYDVYVAALQAVPGQPAFSEDRFRMRSGSGGNPDKDYDMESTRRGLWHSAMAGGVANIWGRFHNSQGDGASDPYPNPEWIKTNAVFFEKHFLPDMTRDNAITDGICLRNSGRSNYVFYKENTTSIQMNLSAMNGVQPSVAVDARKSYVEISLGVLSATDQIWTAPYSSDWAVAVGVFGGPVAPSNLRVE